MMVDFIRNNPLGNNVSIGQATADVMSISPFINPNTAQLLQLNLGIGQWAARNPGPMNQPDFLAAYLFAFGPGSGQIGGGGLGGLNMMF
jgi:hypothetical protein